MREYPVLITEMLQMTVYVEAENPVDAVAKAKAQWQNGDFILDADHFTGVEISAVENGTISMLHRDRNGNEYLEGRKAK